MVKKVARSPELSAIRHTLGNESARRRNYIIKRMATTVVKLILSVREKGYNQSRIDDRILWRGQLEKHGVDSWVSYDSGFDVNGDIVICYKFTSGWHVVSLVIAVEILTGAIFDRGAPEYVLLDYLEERGFIS